DEEALPPARERRPRVAEVVARVGDHAVLGDRSDAHRQAVRGEPCADPEEVQRGMARERQYPEQDAVRQQHAAHHLAAGVEVRPDAMESQDGPEALDAGAAVEVPPDLPPEAL